MRWTARRAAAGTLTLTLAALAAGAIIGTGVQAWDRSGPLLGPLSFRGSGALILLYVPGSLVLGCCWGILLWAGLRGRRPQRVGRLWLVIGPTVALLVLAVIFPPVVFILPWVGVLLVIRWGGMNWASAWLGAGFVLVTAGLLGGVYLATGGRPPGV
jgi:hypothetical protein